MGTFTTAKVGQHEHRCLSALGPFKTAEKTVERRWAVLEKKKKKDKELMLSERTRCVKFLKSMIAESM